VLSKHHTLAINFECASAKGVDGFVNVKHIILYLWTAGDAIPLN
jgi:hypothetical protein